MYISHNLFILNKKHVINRKPTFEVAFGRIIIMTLVPFNFKI